MQFGYVQYFHREGSFSHGSFYPSENSVIHDLRNLGLSYAIHRRIDDAIEKIVLRDGELVVVE